MTKPVKKMVDVIALVELLKSCYVTSFSGDAKTCSWQGSNEWFVPSTILLKRQP